jgi:catechol 2,3-dioxygenase-like lactoylglutathione lyase family enzyme
MSNQDSHQAPARSLVHVGITVPDIVRAVEWYASVLGFDVLVEPVLVRAADGHAGEGASDVFGDRFRSMKIAQLVSGNGVGLELFQFVDPETPKQAPTFDYWEPGPFHICVRDRDVAGLSARIAANGGRRRTAVHESFPGQPYRWCYCEDPFGNVIEIYSHSHEQVYANRVGGTAP